VAVTVTTLRAARTTLFGRGAIHSGRTARRARRPNLASDEPYRLGKIVGSAVAAAARLPTEDPSPTSTGRLNIRDKTHGVAAHP